MLLKKVIQAPQAPKSCRHCHIQNRQARIRQQALGKQKPARLQVLHRGDMVCLHKDAAQMSVRAAKPPRKERKALSAATVFLQQHGRPVCKDGCRIRLRTSWRKLRPAQKTWTETRRLRFCSGREKGAVLLFCLLSTNRRNPMEILLPNIYSKILLYIICKPFSFTLSPWLNPSSI